MNQRVKVWDLVRCVLCFVFSFSGSGAELLMIFKLLIFSLYSVVIPQLLCLFSCNSTASLSSTLAIFCSNFFSKVWWHKKLSQTKSKKKWFLIEIHGTHNGICTFHYFRVCYLLSSVVCFSFCACIYLDYPWVKYWTKRHVREYLQWCSKQTFKRNTRLLCRWGHV